MMTLTLTEIIEAQPVLMSSSDADETAIRQSVICFFSCSVLNV